MSSEYTIRPVRRDDYPHLLALHVAAVMAIAPAYYPPYAQRSTVLGMEAGRFGRAVANGEIFDLACDHATDHPVGYTSVLDSEVMNLFVHPDAQGKGLGKVLLSCAEQRFVTAGVKLASLRASLSAAPFYAHHGWMLKRIGHHRTRGGVNIEVALMEKALG